MTAIDILRLAAFGLGGLILGGASLAVLRWNVALYLNGAPWRPIAAHLARLAVIAGVMIWAARQGAGPLLCLAAGLVLARPIAVRMLGRAA
jgi:hypothetical protein